MLEKLWVPSSFNYPWKQITLSFKKKKNNQSIVEVQAATDHTNNNKSQKSKEHSFTRYVFNCKNPRDWSMEKYNMYEENMTRWGIANKVYAYTWKWRTIIKESLQPNQRVRDCLEINNFNSYKPTKVEPEKEWKCREGWLISANVQSQAAHTKKCIRKGFKISDPTPM